MFTKTLIIVLLSTTLVLAGSVTQKDVKDQVSNEESSRQTVENWLNEVGNTLMEYHEHYKNNAQNLFDELEVISKTAVKIGNEKLYKLKEKYDGIREEAKETIEKKQKEWRSVLKKLKNEGDIAFVEFKEKTKEFIKQETEKFYVKLNNLKEKFTGGTEVKTKK